MTTLKVLSNLNGRRALITGAAGALGRVFAETLAELGADLVLVDLPNTDLDDLSTYIAGKWKVKVEQIECDLEMQDQRTLLISNLNSSGKDLSILVNNAALVGSSSLEGWSVPFENQSIDTWRRAIEINLTAVFDLCQGLSPIMSSSENASIVNIASIYGLHAPDWSLYEGTALGNPAAYGVSKGGLIQLTRWLSTTLAPKVRVNVIAPGGIFRNQPEEFVQRYARKTPLNRMATENDFRGSIAFLASDLSKYVTGQVLSVDGGWGVL
jgi:NAD(P)-dependent dehydrogenase (short-subunit alcohol dehydrogenase family)